MDENIYRLISLTGFFLVAFIAWATGSRQKINVKTIMGSVVLAWVLGVLTFWPGLGPLYSGAMMCW